MPLAGPRPPFSPRPPEIKEPVQDTFQHGKPEPRLAQGTPIWGIRRRASFRYHEPMSCETRSADLPQIIPVVRRFTPALIATLALLASMGGAAHAQDVDWAQRNADACNNALGYVGCSNLGRPQGPPPGIWGAIAFSTATFSSGYSWGQQNAQAAGNAAASECYRSMNAMRDCPVVGSFANACAALATSGKEAAWGYSGPVNNLQQATQAALDRCQKGGGRSCTVVAQLCSPGGPRDASSDAFTAIALSTDSLAWGASWQANTKAEAYGRALNYCQKNGGKQCKVEMWASNSCVALATSEDGAWAVDWNDSKAVAGAKVLQTCRNDKGKNCSVKFSVCASDPR
jgi:Domain of unknown function (DUF4189)